MPKITKGGVSNRLVDPEFIAPPGVSVETALDEGMDNVGKPREPDVTEPKDGKAARKEADPVPRKTTSRARRG